MMNKEANPDIFNPIFSNPGAYPFSISTGYYSDEKLDRKAVTYRTSLKQKLSCWILAFGGDLLWIAFLEEGRPLHCIENPDAARAEPSDWAALGSVLQEASSILPLCCPGGNGHVAAFFGDLLYLSFWHESRAWLVFGLIASVSISRLLEVIDADLSRAL